MGRIHDCVRSKHCSLCIQKESKDKWVVEQAICGYTSGRTDNEVVAITSFHGVANLIQELPQNIVTLIEALRQRMAPTKEGAMRQYNVRELSA